MIKTVNQAPTDQVACMPAGLTTEILDGLRRVSELQQWLVGLMGSHITHTEHQEQPTAPAITADTAEALGKYNRELFHAMGDLRREVDWLTDERKNQSQQIMNLEHELKIAFKHRDMLQAKVDAFEEKNSEGSAESSERIDELVTELKAATDKHSRLEEKLQIADSYVGHLKKKRSLLEADYAELETKYTALEADYAELETKYTELEHVCLAPNAQSSGVDLTQIATRFERFYRRWLNDEDVSLQLRALKEAIETIPSTESKEA